MHSVTSFSDERSGYAALAVLQVLRAFPVLQLGLALLFVCADTQRTEACSCKIPPLAQVAESRQWTVLGVIRRASIVNFPYPGTIDPEKPPPEKKPIIGLPHHWLVVEVEATWHRRSPRFIAVQTPAAASACGYPTEIPILAPGARVLLTPKWTIGDLQGAATLAISTCDIGPYDADATAQELDELSKRLPDYAIYDMLDSDKSLQPPNFPDLEEVEETSQTGPDLPTRRLWLVGIACASAGLCLGLFLRRRRVGTR